MRFELILPTVGRTAEPVAFLEALEAQTHRDFTVMVVDQNTDGRLERLLRTHSNLPIKRLHSPPGLCRARNAALGGLSGEVVAFPDDDCLYPPDLLERVAAFFEHHPEWDGVAGRPLVGPGQSQDRRWPRKPGAITRWNVWWCAVSYTIFLRRRVIDAVGSFDESLGLGSPGPFAAGDETDYLIRALDHGFSLAYEPSLGVYHPEPLAHGRTVDPRRGYDYGVGMGAVLRKHRYPLAFLVYVLFRPVAGLSFAAVNGRRAAVNLHWQALRGRIAGWRMGSPSNDGYHLRKGAPTWSAARRQPH